MRPLFSVAIAAATVVACGGGGGGAASPSPAPPPPVTPAYRPTGLAASGATMVHLFEWRWSDIARECEVWLGPRGFAAVQISPPGEHALITNAAGSGINYPWWQRYQTVSYKLDRSRSGTLAEFTDMVNRCRAAGVDIYADAVINHMTAGSGSGSAGDAFTKYSYPAVPYGAAEFHSLCSVSNYQDAGNVQNCELVGLADLKTEDNGVRDKIANYLITLNQLGVRGFRIDAAKHIAPTDLEAMLTRVNAAAAGARPLPYVFFEVINNADEAVTAQQYFGAGYASGGAVDITEFQYGYRVSDAFLGRNGATLTGLQSVASVLMPSDKAVIFADNHDNQRGSNIYYGDGPNYELALIYTLAQPTGYPSVMSSYGFDRTTQSGRDAGPPSDASGNTQSTFDANGNSRCTANLGVAGAGTWVCEHRRAAVARMVQLRKFAAGAPLTSWQVLGTQNQIAFARSGRAFVALNRETAAVSNVSVQTSLPAGSYCDVVSGEPNGTICTGTVVSVAANGSAQISVPARGAVALHGGARIQ